LLVALSIPVGCRQNDQQNNIDEQIEAKLDSQNLKDVDADVKDNGRVELTGTVESDNQKLQAEEAVRGVSGVKGIDNLINVSYDENNTSVDNDVDNTGDKADDTGVLVDKDGNVDNTGDLDKDRDVTDGAPNDTWLSFKTKLALYADNRVPGNDINVESNKGVVTLIGKVPDAQSKTTAVEVARKIEGVKNVKDQLQVVPSAKREIIDENDETITDNVDAAFDKDKGINDLNLDVVTNNGVVTLTGTANNMNQVEKAVKAAYAVKGVRAVNANAVVINDQNANKNVNNTEQNKDKKKSGGY
jgi:osmotically-inducible protein OsmY